MADDRSDEIKKQAARLPLLPGVYKYLDREGTVIYVGKAKSLRKRVMSYFVGSASHSPKVKVLVRQIAAIEHIVVEHEDDALLLENNLIKQLQPKYNIMLKDDKSYPWIVVRNEPFPRVESTRKLVRDGSKYYGPYASVMQQKTLLDLIHAIYPLRTCKLKLTRENIAAGKFDLCLQYHIGNCTGPCKGKEEEVSYNERIKMIEQILKGNLRPTKEYLTRLMEEAAAELRFEAAADYKAKLAYLENYQSKSIIVSSAFKNFDVFSLVVDGDAAYCNYVRIANGAVVNTFTVEMSLGAQQEDSQQILTRAIEHISSRFSNGLADEVIVPFMPHAALFPGVKFTVPKIGDKLKLLEFSQRGAKLYRLEKMKNIEIKDPQRHTNRILDSMQRELRLPAQPRHIECFDNSNLQGTNAVSACVVFRDAKPSKKEYRHFNVKTVVGADDYATMREIIGRRYSRVIAEGGDIPDLIVIDGGKGQLRIASEVLRELGLGNVPVIGLAERLEEVFYPGDPVPYYLERGGEPLKVIMHIRDEAHRFGLAHHRNKRSSAFIRSELESIPGVGGKSIEKLLKKFKSVAGIRRASEKELAESVGATRAKALREHFEKGS